MTEGRPDAPRVALTGAGGMLGREVVRAATERGIPLVAWDRAACDVTDERAVAWAVHSAAPSVVLHAAAWTDVDGCEADPDRALLVNARGTANVAAACRAAGIRLVAVSTDYVFDGAKEGAYVEDDAPGPLSVYGWSKLLAEEAALALGGAGCVVRTAWVYADHGRNFLRTMLELGARRERVEVVDDQRGCPTFAADLAATLLDVCTRAGAHGVLHAVNAGAVTWNGFARAIFAGAGLGAEAVPVTTDRFPRPARRPRNSVLGGRRLAALGIDPPPPWQDGLARALARRRAAADGHRDASA